MLVLQIHSKACYKHIFLLEKIPFLILSNGHWYDVVAVTYDILSHKEEGKENRI